MSRHTGELWVRKPTETLQYHVEGETKTVFPEPHALVLDENIKDGDLVSLAYKNGKTGVVRTNSSDIKRVYGFARITNRDPEMDLPGEGELVEEESVIEVQTYGAIRLPFSSFTYDPTPSDVGMGIFAVTPEEYAYRRGTTSEPGKCTLSRFEATTFGGNIIEVGVVREIDTENEYVTAKVIIGGDSRGPVGLTEVEYQTNQLIPTENTPRVYAYVSNEEPRNHREVVEWHIDSAFSLDNLNDSWLAFDMFFATPEGRSRTQKRTLVIYFTTDTSAEGRQEIRDDILENGLRDSQSGSIRKTIPSINAEGPFEVKDEDSIALVEIPPGGTGASRRDLLSAVISSVDSALENIFDYDDDFDPRFKLTITNDVLEKGDKIATGEDEEKTLPSAQEDFTLIFETKNSKDGDNERGGIIYFYRNPYLRNEDPGIEMKHYITRYGQLETPEDEFRVVPADRRRFLDANSSNADKLVTLAGALASPIPTTDPRVYVHRGANVMMQKMGLIDGFEELKVGKKVYLGNNGHVTQRPQDILYDEYLVELGVAKNENQIDLRLGTPQVKATTRDSIPVGVIVPRAYDLSKDPPEPSDPPPGFLELEGQTLQSEEYPDLYYALTGESPGEFSPALILHNDPSHLIKAYSFNLYPDTATPEIPVQARRYETPWHIIDGSNVSPDGNTIHIPHALGASLRDVIGYVVISATDASGGPGDLGRPMADAPEVIMYPGYGSDEGDFFGFQFEEQTMDDIRARIGGNGLRVSVGDSLLNVTSTNVSEFMDGAQNFSAKFVIYKIENIYDFKDDRLIKKANEFWYDHRRRYYWDDDVEVHGVRATTKPDEGTLIRRDENERAQVSFPYEYTEADGYADSAITSTADDPDITNKEYVDNMDQANRNWTDNNLQTHKDTEDEGIHGSSYTEEGNKLMHRSSDGRSRVADPDHRKDATNKGYVDDADDTLQSNINTLDDYVKNDLQEDLVQDHIDTTSEGIHGSTVSAGGNRLIIRDSNGNAYVAYPIENGHIATKEYVDDEVSGLDQRRRENLVVPTEEPDELEDGSIWVE